MAARFALVVLLLACVVLPASGRLPASFAVYAYTTDHDVVVMRGEREMARWSGGQLESAVSEVVWTGDGLRAAFLANKEPKNRELIVVDVPVGRMRTVKCLSCSDIAAIGKSSVMLGERQGTDDTAFTNLLLLDLARDEPPVELPTSLPGLQHVTLMSGSEDEVLLIGVSSENSESYHRVRADGTSDSIGTWRILRYDSYRDLFGRGIAGGAATRNADGEVVYAVVGVFGQRDRCERVDEVLLVVPGKSAVLPTNFTAAVPPEKNKATSTSVTSVWWDRDNHLHAAVVARTCYGDDKSLEPTTGEWVLRQGVWQQVSQERLFDVRRLNDGTAVVVTHDDSGASLQHRTSAGPTAVPDRVLAVDAPYARASGDVTADLCVRSDAGCLAKVGGRMEVGRLRADVDGDGKDDEITVDQTWPREGETSLNAHVRLSSGGEVRSVLATDSLATPWLGAADVDNDRRAELFVPSSNGVHTTMVTLFSLADGGFRPTEGDVRELMIGGSTYESSGFRCVPGGGVRASIVIADWDDSGLAPARFDLHETTYAPDATGVLRRTETRTTPTAAEPGGEMPDALREIAGAHCPGMARFPGS